MPRRMTVAALAAACLLGQSASADFTPRNFVIECDPVSVAMKAEDGTAKSLNYVVLATSDVEQKTGAITYIPDTTNSTLSTVGPSGRRSALISHTTAYGDAQQDWRFVSSDISLEIKSGTCDLSKRVCDVTLTLGDTITGATTPDTHASQATATCAAYYALTIPEAIQAALAFSPSAAAAHKQLEAAALHRGPVWERFFPQISTSFEQIRTNTQTNFPSIAGPPLVNSLAAQAVLPLSMVQLFAWRAEDLGVRSAEQGIRALENGLAEKAIGLYIGIELAREQRRLLQDGFMVPLQKMAADPKVQANAQLSGAVGTLVTGLTNAMIAAKYGLLIAEDQFRLLTGITIDSMDPDVESPQIAFYSSDVIPTAIPHVGTAADAVAAAMRSSPAMVTARLALQSQKNAQRIAEWTPFSLNVGYGPTSTWTTINPALPVIGSRANALTYGAAVQFDVWGFVRGVRSAHRASEAQELSLQEARNSLEGQIDQDWLTGRQQVETLCTDRPQIASTFATFGQLYTAIAAGQDYDPVAAAQNFPLALQTLTSLYGAETSAMSAVADILAQIGNLSQPETWDFSKTPGDVCAEVAAAKKK